MTQHVLVSVAILLLLWPTVPYWAGPFVLWLTFRQRTYSTNVVIEPAMLPAPVRQYFDSLTADVARAGFSLTGYVCGSGAVANVSSYVALWTHVTRGQTATAAAVLPAVGRTVTFLEFQTVTAPHVCAVLTSNNGSDAGMFDADAWRHKAQLPWVSRPLELYQVHLNRERRFVAPGAARYLPEPTRIAEVLDEAGAFILRDQVRSGLFRETPQAGEFRLTFAGAWRAAYRVLPPLRQIRLRRATRESRTDHAEALAHPATPTEHVAITHVSPFALPAGRYPLSYA